MILSKVRITVDISRSKIFDLLPDGKVKCVQYIPLENEQSALYGMYKVTRKDKTVEFCKDVVLQVFEVSVPEKLVFREGDCT